MLDPRYAHDNAGRLQIRALWEGYGWIAEQLAGPKVEQPGRAYFLFRGSLSSIGQLGWKRSADWFDPQSPNMFWPVDKAWFVASEIDFDSTIVASSVDLVHALITAPGIDAWPIGPDDSLAYDADVINT